MAQRFRLDNGMCVLFEEQHAAKVAAFQVWVKAGSADERPDQAGLAHLHEHMLFKGTARRGPGEVARDVEAHGGEINAWTSLDQTVYHVVLASTFARSGLDILADAVRAPAFDAGELAREIEVVCEEIKRSDDSPSRRASRELFSTAYRVHPYQRPVTGWAETVRSFDRDKVLEFYRRHYTPQNMVLVAVGDLERGQVEQWAQELLGGSWERSYPGPVARSAEPTATGRRVAFKEDDVKEAYLHLAFHIPDVRHTDVPALDVLAMLAGQGEASRLVSGVKRRRQLVNDIGSYAYTPTDPGLWMVSLTAPGANAASALQETARVLSQLRQQPVPQEELDTVKRIFESETVYQRETVQGVARKLGFYESGAGGIEAEARYYEQVAALSPEDVRRAAETYLRLDRAVLTGLLPPGVQLPPAEAAALLDEAAQGAPGPAPSRGSPNRSASTVALRVMPSSGNRRTDIAVETLPSGARVVIREETAVPLVAVRAAYLGGLRYENDATNGLNHLLAKTLTRGTATREAEDITQLVDSLQGSLGAAAGRNSIGLRSEFLSKHLDRAFELFSDVLNHPTFPAAELERERRLALQDVLTRDDKPSQMVFELFYKTLYRQHPYRLSTFGEKAPLEALQAQDLLRFHRQWMDPSQLTLCVVGDVKTDEVLALAHEAFGKTRGGAQPAPKVAPEPKPTQAQAVKKTLPRAQAHLVIGGLGLALSDPERYALEVLSTVLSGQGGRLFIELRDKQSLAYSVSCFSAEGLEPGTFGVYMGTSAEKLEQALAGIRAELERIRQEPIRAEELERAKQHLVGTHEIGLQRNGARAAVLALDTCYGLGLEPFLQRTEKVLAVTADEVLAAARKVVTPETWVTAVVGP